MNGMALPTGRRGQAFALAGLAALVLLLWLGLVAPLAGWYAARADAIDRQSAVVAHLSVLASRLGGLEQRLAASAHPNAGAGPATDARAGADLQQQIEGMAGTAGAHLGSVEFLPPEQADGYQRIPLRVSLSARWPALIALLAAIETASPPLLLDDLHVRAAGSEGDPAPGAEASFVVILLRVPPARQGVPS